MHSIFDEFSNPSGAVVPTRGQLLRSQRDIRPCSVPKRRQPTHVHATLRQAPTRRPGLPRPVQAKVMKRARRQAWRIFVRKRGD
ncbi:MAG: hypothetical protein AAB601_03210 [Patescibacteria group bacterium]